MPRRISFALCLVLAFALAVVPGADASEPGPGGTLFLDCGEIVGNDAAELVNFTLGNNLTCTGDALRIQSGANGITIDLGGHRISGDGGSGEDGLFFDGTNGVTVRNGVIAGFDRGVLMQGTNDTIEDLTLVDNQGDSVQLGGANNTVQDNTITRGGNVFLLGTGPGTDVLNNLIVGESVVFSGADDADIDGNRILGGGINAAQGADGSADNFIDNNEIIAPPTAGITVSGDGSDGNEIRSNTIVGAGQRGIDVNDGDFTFVQGNVVTGSANDGIEVRGSATFAGVSFNSSSGNTEDGIQLGSTATGAQVAFNTTNENGDNGIEATNGSGPNLNDNIANFNGFFNGLANDDGLGISAPDGGTTTGNAANGNDVVDELEQCNLVNLCTEPDDPAADPPLLPCNQVLNIPATFTLRHPLDCPTGDALKIAASDVVLDLAIHRVSGGGVVWSEASVAIVTPGTTRATVRNGVLVNSGNGIRIADTTKTRLDDVVLARNVGSGAAMYRTNENVLLDGASLKNGGDGVTIRNGDLNRIADMDLGGNATAGVVLVKTSADPAILEDRSSRNTIENNSIIGQGGVGIGLSNSNNNTILNNDVIGGDTFGAQIAGNVTGSPKNVVTGNRFNGNEIVGVAIDADSAAGGAGSPGNRLVSNEISASPDGLVVRDPETTGTVLKKNTFLFNDRFGAQIQLGATATKAVKNVATGNGTHGIFFDGVKAGNVVRNTTNRNGFVSTVGDDVGLGIFASAGGKGCGNKAVDNDDPAQIVPAKFKKPCS